ncbi:MAG: S1 RNA-binding domain-containing protein, partial [Pseudomonadota bacterium]|nr:S1 RNA-binding domain-containing protein [Pseudomonadota bacterium]
FVDIGVHQDGLVHVSQLADRFVKDPHEVVKAGDVVKVRVTEVDVPRNRIGLSMRKDGGAVPAARGGQGDRQDRGRSGGPGGSRGGSRGGPGGGKFSSKPQGKPHGKPQGKGNDTGALGAALMDAMKKR